jgi:hypothetical protein
MAEAAVLGALYLDDVAAVKQDGRRAILTREDLALALDQAGRDDEA